MADKSWKAYERRVAKDFKSTRTPLSGGNSKQTRADVLHDTLYIECKIRKNMSIWSLFRDTEEKAKQENKIPVCAVKETNKQGYLIVCRPEDLGAIVNEYKTT